MMLQQRNIAVCIILTIVTCGIYGIFWVVSMNDEVNRLSNDWNAPSGGVVVLLTIVTCGIYGIYWAYKMGERLDKVDAANGRQSGDRPILYLLLAVFALAIVDYALIQDSLNKYAPAPAGNNQPYQQYQAPQQPYQQPPQQQYQQPYQQPPQQQYQQQYQQPQQNNDPRNPGA